MAGTPLDHVTLPADLLPADGRFGSGPSKVRADQLDRLGAAGRDLLGTSHRQAPVRNLVAHVQEGLAALFALPDDWEVVIGNGGSTAFWDAASFGIVERRSAHAVFGEFSGKFAAVTAAAPHLDEPVVVTAPPGRVAEIDAAAAGAVDTIALTHNETSTGVAVAPHRPGGDGLVVVDATSAAGALPWSPAHVDVYYFAPQKCFGADGGTWLACCSPAALERIARLGARRWTPAFLDLSLAADNSRAHQTYNTPALATLVMLDEQVGWLLDHGGLDWAHRRVRESSGALYAWAEASPAATPFVADPGHRSPVVATVDLAGVDATALAAVLRRHGIVDVEPYRKLGRNQIRVGCFPSVEPDDVRRLVACLDHLVDVLAGPASPVPAEVPA